MAPRFIPLEIDEAKIHLEELSKEKKLENYLTESAKTLSGKFYYDSNFESEPDVYHYTKKAIAACQELDLVKKKKFYNKDIDISSSAPKNIKFLKEDSGENTLHAAIGLTTECGEILEAIMKHKYEGKELDVVNIKEEIGDLMWYLAILLRDHNIDLFDAMDINIKKLRARYGEKFSTDKAINRDLSNERTILESNGSTYITGMTSLYSLKSPFSNSLETIEHINGADNRALENGGMAPPKDWQSLVDIQLNDKVKRDIIEQMRGMQKKGQTIDTNSIAKPVITIEEFTQPFLYLESVKNYTGGFLVTLLKSEVEIDTQARSLNLNLSEQKRKCANGDLLILHIYDIYGSESNNEQKKFFITLEFDKLNGTLTAKGIISSKPSLSQRQFSELERFCKIKNIQITR